MVTAPDAAPTSMPPEGQARALLRGHPSDGLEAWLAEQRWRASVAGAVTSWLVV